MLSNTVDEGPINWNFEQLISLYSSKNQTYMMESVINLGKDAQDSFRAKLYRPAIAFSGEACVRLNWEVLIRYLLASGSVNYQYKNKKFQLNAENYLGHIDVAYRILDEDEYRLNFCDLIHLLENIGLIDHDVALDMHALRNLRNKVIHGHLPILNPYSPPLPLGDEAFKKSFRESIINILESGEIPFKDDQYRFQIEIRRNVIETYTVDQERLKINLNKLNIPDENHYRHHIWEAKYAVISLAIMFLMIEYFANNLDSKIDYLATKTEKKYEPNDYVITFIINNDGVLQQDQELIDVVSDAIDKCRSISVQLFIDSTPYYSFLNRCIKLVFDSSMRPYIETPEDILLCIQGLVDKMLPRLKKEEPVDKLRIDLFYSDNNKINEVIGFDEEEVEILTEKFKSDEKSISHHLNVLDLPKSLRIKKAIPAIIFFSADIHRKKELQDYKDLDDYKKLPDLLLLFRLDKWLIGPH